MAAFESSPGADRPGPEARAATWALLLLGILGGQLVMLGPSLFGGRILATTDQLVAPGALNMTGTAAVPRAQHVMMDPVQVFYPWLDFAAREVRAGRLPTWNPYAYCGSPFLANMQSAVFSPFTAPYYLWPGPGTLAWIAVLKAVVAGVGAFGFARSIGLRRWPAIVGGWCYPMAGFLTIWQAFPLSGAASWLPMGMWAVASVVRRPFGWGGPGLAAVVGLMLVSGHLETTAHVLLGMGLFGLWSWVSASRVRIWGREPRRVAGVAGLGLALGFALGAAQVVPTLAYVQSSYRLHLRQTQQIEGMAGAERPGANLGETVRLAYPLLLGTEQAGSRPLTPRGLHESGANGFVGVSMLLLLPIGLLAGRRRAEGWFWLVFAAWFAAPMFGIPVLRWWHFVPPFHIVANSRALLMTGWGVFVLGLRGLDALCDREVIRPRVVLLSCGIAALLLLGLIAARVAPEILRRDVPSAAWPWFRQQLDRSAVLTGIGLFGVLGWLLVPVARRVVPIGLGMLAIGELLVTASGLNPQVDPATFYPTNPLCSYLADRVGDGRICGQQGALPPNLAMMYRLRDVRGYDAVDPMPYVELLMAMDAQFGPTHAITWNLTGGPSPVLDLLGVRFFVTRTPFPPLGDEPKILSGMFVYENPNALPRAFIPRRAVLVPGSADRLRRLGDPAFDPRSEAFVTEASRLPVAPMSGEVRIESETPDRVVLSADCAAESLVVLADSWDLGWIVRVDGRPAEALQVNHALRGVVVPEGAHRIEWTYRPSSVRWGLIGSLGGLIGLAGFSVAVGRPRRLA